MKTTIKFLGLTIISLLLSSNLISQTWGGSGTTTGNTTRSGNVNIIQPVPFTVPISLPNNHQLLVSSDSKKYGIRATCGNNTNYGINTEVVNPNTIAFSVTKPILALAPAFTTFTPSNNETFVVLGDGRVFATEITVKNFPVFPDYVFNKNYDLLTLYEIEKYINKYKHLPNIPSAKEVAEKGLSLGTMQVLQMEKIEELTLHLIELKKANDLLLKENELLKLEID